MPPDPSRPRVSRDGDHRRLHGSPLHTITSSPSPSATAEHPTSKHSFGANTAQTIKWRLAKSTKPAELTSAASHKHCQAATRLTDCDCDPNGNRAAAGPAASRLLALLLLREGSQVTNASPATPREATSGPTSVSAATAAPPRKKSTSSKPTNAAENLSEAKLAECPVPKKCVHAARYRAIAPQPTCKPPVEPPSDGSPPRWSQEASATMAMQ
mmetsp:Transcript_4717/g.20157  ORF Transcript_4717/g.20157 Transcript_4717/m.20157 type:complete len:213 (+) Transcript_4717:3722-4360(+)